ncbi:MAG: OmpH family outer membrane protein [Bacteroidales bacterium]|nr:OmpH family outer membrane protein [Bacteroidales bacterium]
MKNVSWVVNGVLTIAVIVLFVLHFSDSDQERDDEGSIAEHETVVNQKADLKVAYVFIDSLLANYQLAQELTDQLLKSKDGLEKELASKGKKLEKKISDYQYKVQKGLITSWDAKAQEAKLTEEQQVYLNLQKDMQNRLMTDEQNMNQKVYTTIIDFVNQYNDAKGYNIILSQTTGGVLLYAEDYMNITKDILDGLNAAHAESK